MLTPLESESIAFSNNTVLLTSSPVDVINAFGFDAFYQHLVKFILKGRLRFVLLSESVSTQQHCRSQTNTTNVLSRSFLHLNQFSIAISVKRFKTHVDNVRCRYYARVCVV